MSILPTVSRSIECFASWTDWLTALAPRSTISASYAATASLRTLASPFASLALISAST